MPHYTNEQTERANSTDLSELLKSRGEKLKRSGRQYLWEKHQVWIDGCRWYSHYESEGGYAVGFLMKYYGMDFQSAVGELLGNTSCDVRCVSPPVIEEKSTHELILPPRNQTMDQVFAYLMGKRFIARDIIRYFAHEGLLYEDSKYHNCVFVGNDESGVPRHIHCRSTADTFRITAKGSSSEYSFHYNGTDDTIYVFEAPIDMLAFITMYRDSWQAHSYVALCSVSEKALLHRLEVDPGLRRIILCLDNDSAGLSAMERIKKLLNEKGYGDVSIMMPENKDWDEDIKAMNGRDAVPAGADKSKGIFSLCRSAVNEAAYMKKPVMLTEKLRDAFGSVINRGCRDTVYRFLLLLLLQLKDEYRKAQIKAEWSDIEKKICDGYITYSDNGSAEQRLRMIISSGRKLFEDYDDIHSAFPLNHFTAPIEKLCMDCIRYLCFTEGSASS